ncbi:MAG: RDD family protein [Opitutaceae bacterium]
MKKIFQPLLPLPKFALWGVLQLAVAAQPTPTPAEPATTATTPVAPTAADDDKAKLRRLDTPAADKAGEAPPPTKKSRAQQIKERADAAKQRARDRAAARTGTDVVNVFGHAHQNADQKSDVVVAVFGSATAEGEVTDSVVSVFGANRATGLVHGEVVAIFGNSYVNCPVGQNVVVVFGNLELGPEARIAGQVVCVGGSITRDPAVTIKGGTTNVLSVNVEWLSGWFEQCLLKARPLAFDRRVGWAWATALSFLAFYLLLALLFPKPLVACAETLESRPGYSILASILTVLLTPVAIVALALTVVGAVLIPFLGAGLMFAGLFGKAVMLAWLGRRLTKFFGDGPLGHPAFAVLMGGLIVMLLYTVPFAGYLFYKLLTWIGLGVVVYTIVLAMKREKTAATVPAAAAPLPYAVPPPVSPSVSLPIVGAPGMSRGFTGSGVLAAEFSAGSGGMPLPPVAPQTAAEAPRSLPIASPLVQSIPWERAGFFIRLGALAIDAVLIGAITGFLSDSLPRALSLNHGPGGVLLGLAIYGALMWKVKGTTIGGIVCSLKVVRLDRREIDWATAIVRALGCFLSLMPAGLGFIWVAFDDERQSWHDKIAGTTVVRAPKGTSLV